MLSALQRLARHLRHPSALPSLIRKNAKRLLPRRSPTSVRERRSVPAEFFEALYAREPDPWKYRTSPYEQEKFAATLAALPEPRFRRGLDIGCSIGVLTRQLARRCDQLLAIDVVDAALALARSTCADAPHVTFARMRIPSEWPDGPFDLIVISEVLYYLDPPDIRCAAAACLRSLEPRGTIVLVNFLSPKRRPSYGDEAVALFSAALAGSCRPVLRRRADLYRLDVLRLVP
jgi:SAM-dependent methyltransferase